MKWFRRRRSVAGTGAGAAPTSKVMRIVPATATLLAGAVLVAVLTLAGCGGSGGGSSGSGSRVALSPLAQKGKQVAASTGCASCHGTEGGGGVGPAWKGLAGSKVKLTDGSTVVADQAYLRRSIVDPSAQKVAGYDAAMPRYPLSSSQVDALVSYIEALKGS